MFWLFWCVAAALFWIGTVHSAATAVQAAILTVVPTVVLLRMQGPRRH